MPDQESIRGQLNLLDTLRKRLRIQINQQKTLGAHAPAYMQLEIDNAQEQIRKIKAYLLRNGVHVEHLAEDGEEAIPTMPATPASAEPEVSPSDTVVSELADVFISYHPADKAWVRTDLLPRFDRAGLSYIVDYRDFAIGAPKIVNMENAVEHSRHTLIVLTPDWLASDWNNLQGLLAQSTDPIGVERKLLPLVLKTTSLPKRIAYIEAIDATDEGDRAFQLERLIQSLVRSRENDNTSNLTQLLIDQSKKPAEQFSTADFVIITALEEERDAVLSKLPGYRKLAPARDDIRVYYTAAMPVKFSDNTQGEYSVVVTTLLGMGRVQAADAAKAAIYRWQPRYVLMVGIAGGIAEARVKVGDILISNQIVDYELQKLTTSGAQIRWEVHRADPRLLSAVSDFPYALWKKEIAIERPGPGDPTRHVGPIASGDKVIALADVPQSYREMWPKLIGVEMEAGGVATAAFQSANPPGFFMIRGVSDLADAKKGSRNVERWRSYACDVAAAYTIGLLKSGPVPPK